MAILYLLLGLASILCYIVFQRRKKLPGKPIPGPKGWPLVGQGFELKPETIHRQLSEYTKQYGDIIQVQVFRDRIISLGSADLIRKACNNEPYKRFMNDRPLSFYGERVMFRSESPGLYPKAFGGIHGDLRKGVTKALHVYGDGIKAFEDRITRELCRLHTVMEAQEGQDFQLDEILKRSLTNVVSCLLSGEDLQDNDRDINMLWQLDHTFEVMVNPSVNAALFMFPFLVKFPGYYRQVYEDSVNAKNRVLQRFFTNIEETHKPGVVRGIVDYLLDEQAREITASRDGSDVIFTDQRIKCVILEIVVAGILSTLSSITNTILCLINHPEYQERLYEELNTVIGPDKMPVLGDRSKCPFLEAVTTESARYIPITPLLTHYCSKDEGFEGFHIPADSIIIPNIWHVHHDEAVWGDPWTFRPDRWLDESGQILPSTHPLRKHWLSFGTGRRQCLGEQFARSRQFLYLASLLKTYKFTATPGHCGSCDPRTDNFDNTLTVRAKPYFCKATRRNT